MPKLSCKTFFYSTNYHTVKTEMLLWPKVCCFSWMLDTRCYCELVTNVVDTRNSSRAPPYIPTAHSCSSGHNNISLLGVSMIVHWRHTCHVNETRFAWPSPLLLCCKSQTGGRGGLGMRLALTSGRYIVCMWLSRTGALNCISRLSDIVVVTVLSQWWV